MHDYTRREGIEHAEIVLPQRSQAEWAKDRSALSNAAEQAQQRADVPGTDGAVDTRERFPTGSRHPSRASPAVDRSSLNPAFASDLDDLLAAAQPALWVHGHTHCSLDYRVRATRVICNLRGYGTENPAFDPNLVVEVSP